MNCRMGKLGFFVAWILLLVRVAPAQAQTPVDAAFPRPQEPQPPFPYGTEAVSYENPTDGTQFAGTLTIPEGDGPFPAVLMIAGSGSQDRNATTMGHKPFLVISDYLTRRGIAVLRVDDRGVGGSTGGSVRDATILELIGDAQAGVAFLRSRPQIDPDRVGLVGHSQGGLIAPGVASETGDVAFVVLLAGPSVTGRELIQEQSRAMLEASGVELIEERLEIARTMMDLVLSISESMSVRQLFVLLSERVEQEIASRPREQAGRMRMLWDAAPFRQAIAAEIASVNSAWFRSLVDYDPVESLRGLRVPSLALYGERDLQVPADQSVPILREAWGGHPDGTIHVVPELNHLFQHAETGLIQEYAGIEETFAVEALDLIGDWIDARFVKR